MSSNIKKIETKKFLWLDIINATQADLKYIKKEFNFDTEDINDCLPIMQRQKVQRRKGYVFMVIQMPLYNRETGILESSEVDLFVSKKYLITIHSGQLKPLVDLFELYQTDAVMKSNLRNEELSPILHKILFKLYSYCYPILNHINLDINQIEYDILKQSEEKTVRQILILKRNIVNYQRTLQSHRALLQKFLETSDELGYSETTKAQYADLLSHTKDIWDYLTNYKDTINALHDTQSSLTSLKINEIMKTLTIFSVVVFPLTLLAAIFGMNTLGAMPFVESPHGFWYIMGIMFIGMMIMFGFFKKRKWL